MPYAAISYDVKPGHEEELEKIFAGFGRVDSPVLHDESGQAAGRLVGTAVFVRDGLLVRVIDYEGDLADLQRHMARQPAVRELEQRLAPYLAAPRDTSTPGHFREYFQKSLMRCISQLSAADHPARGGRA